MSLGYALAIEGGGTGRGDIESSGDDDSEGVDILR